MTVVSVTRVDEQVALWVFSSQVLSVANANGLLIDGQEPDAVEPLTPEGALPLHYTDAVSGGAAWDADGSVGVAITFAGGGILTLPESGSVVA